MSHSLEIKIGCSGFYNRHWKGLFYPEKLPQKEWLNFYCEHFNTLELNSTFYRFPTLKSMQTWYDKSPAHFQFSVKASKIITHLKKFNACQDLIKDLYDVCRDGLKDKLACVLFQLPPSIQYSEERLAQIISSLDQDFKNVVEFRHESWWRQDVYDALAKAGIVFVSVDHPKLPTTIITNTSTVYVRLHGSPKMFYSNYSKEDQQHLLEVITQKPEIKEAYIYFNNTAGDAGIINAQEMQSLVASL